MTRKPKLQSPPAPYSKARQGDLAVTGLLCPTCGRPWNRIAIKVCRLCGEVLQPNHRYRMVPAGPGLFALEHRDCTDPTSKLKPAGT